MKQSLIVAAVIATLAVTVAAVTWARHPDTFTFTTTEPR